MDCWAKGGGKEGQGPQGKKAKKSGKLNSEAANIAEDKDRVWMAAVDDSSDADDEGELVGCFGEEDDEDFWFTDSKSNSPPSPTSTFDFIDSSDIFNDSGDLLDNCELMPDLQDITDSSDDEEDNIPLLKSFSDSSEDEDGLYCDYKVPEKSVNVEEEYDSMPELTPDYDDSEDNNSEVGDFSGEFLDGEVDGLVEDLGEDAVTRTFTCAMLANTGRITEGVEKPHDSGASCHMTAYRDRLENFGCAPCIS